MPIFIFELIFTFLTVCFGFTCSFKDPGIVTHKSLWFKDIEAPKIPMGIQSGFEYYQ